MTWIKICGITNLEDALTAVEAGADALGFVFYEKSPRRVDVETAREIIAKLPERVEKVGVFVDESLEDVRELADRSCLTGLQLLSQGGSLSAAGLRASSVKRILTVFPVKALFNGEFEGGFFGKSENSIDGILFDSGSMQLPGGTGQAFDWAEMAPVINSFNGLVKTVVAGGLNPTNVAEAMRILHPWGVDVCSGVEARHGKKDPQKVKAFISAVREADRVH